MSGHVLFIVDSAVGQNACGSAECKETMKKQWGQTRLQRNNKRNNGVRHDYCCDFFSKQRSRSLAARLRDLSCGAVALNSSVWQNACGSAERDGVE